MNKATKRALLRICDLFSRLDAPARSWVLARLSADHAEMLRTERDAA